MKDSRATDYETYREIMDELLNPIMAEGLEMDTLKSLYESKSVYLENLRIKCFWELNSGKKTHFEWEDYHLILRAITENKNHIRKLILLNVTTGLDRRKVS